MSIKLKFALAATMLAATFHCAGKSSLQVATAGTEIKAPAEATSVAARVLADTGATLSIGNSLQLTVPAGALATDTDISVRKNATAPQQENLVPIGSSIELGAHGTEFNKAVALNVCYDATTLAAKGLSEDTLQVYYLDEQSGNYAAIGGQINKASHCVSAQLAHFSTYLIAAQILQGGNNLPVVSAPTFTPSVPLAGLPLKLSTIITDYELSTVNGQVGFGQVATAQLFYRIPGETSYTQVSLTPDYSDDTATRYSYKIPANRVTTAGIEYYLRASDNLGLIRLRNVANLNIARTATSIAFATTAAIDLAAGFKRSYTLRAIDDLGAARNIDVDTFTLNGGIGTAAKTGPSVIQVSATTAGAQNYRIGSLTATSGAFSVTSADIRVHAGMLDHIALLSPTGVILGSTITVNANATYDFDLLGYDAFGNTTNVLPLFVLVPVTGGGSITATGLYTAPTTAQTVTLVATLDGVQDSILINVVVPPAPSILGTAMLQSGRYIHTATRLLDGRVLFTGGLGNSGYLATAEIFDPSMNAGLGGYVATDSMSTARFTHTAVLLADGRVLISGGHSGASPLATNEIFDPAGNSGAGSFTLTSTLLQVRYNHTATQLADGRILVAGGNGTVGFVSQAEVFDPNANGGAGGIFATGTMVNPSQGSAATALLDGRVLITGGISSSGYSSASEIFDPLANGGVGGFTSTANMTTAREYHTSTRLADGRILLAGGRISNVSNGTADIFDPAGNAGLGSISSTGNMTLPRDLHTATLLNNGKVLLAGGQNSTVPTGSTELFDPAGNSGQGHFSSGPILGNARLWHSAVLLLGGRVLISGGDDYSNAPLASSELYIP